MMYMIAQGSKQLLHGTFFIISIYYIEMFSGYSSNSVPSLVDHITAHHTTLSDRTTMAHSLLVDVKIF